MLKFQNNHTTTIETFEDFTLIIFVMIDDLYQQYSPVSVYSRCHINDAKLSDSEIITISICDKLAKMDSEHTWFSFGKKNYRYLFPKIGDQSRFNRTRRNFLQVTERLRDKLISIFSMLYSQYFIIDSFPFLIYQFGRVRYCHSFRGYGADYRNCLSKKRLTLDIKYML